MKKQMWLASLAAFVLVTGLSLTSVYAYGGYGGFHGKGKGMRCGDGGFDKIFMMKAHFVLENADELGLSDDKVEAIRTLKMETKKAKIRQDAEIEILGLDIMTKMHASPMDVEAINQLIDQKYELKKAKAKSLVEALAKLKANLTQEQTDKMRELWKSAEKEERGEHREGRWK